MHHSARLLPPALRRQWPKVLQVSVAQRAAPGGLCTVSGCKTYSTTHSTSTAKWEGQLQAVDRALAAVEGRIAEAEAKLAGAAAPRPFESPAYLLAEKAELRAKELLLRREKLALLQLLLPPAATEGSGHTGSIPWSGLTSSPAAPPGQPPAGPPFAVAVGPAAGVVTCGAVPVVLCSPPYAGFPPAFHAGPSIAAPPMAAIVDAVLRAVHAATATAESTGVHAPPAAGVEWEALSKAIADVVARFGRPATPSPGPAEATAASEPPRCPAASAATSPVGEAPAAATTTAAKPAGEEAPAAPHAAPPPPPSDTHGTSARDAGPRSAEAGAKRSSGSPEEAGQREGPSQASGGTEQSWRFSFGSRRGRDDCHADLRSGGPLHFFAQHLGQDLADALRAAADVGAPADPRPGREGRRDEGGPGPRPARQSVGEMSVADLKRHLDARGLDYRGKLEKRELVDLLARALAAEEEDEARGRRRRRG
eukprot:EG_transcript_7534